MLPRAHAHRAVSNSQEATQVSPVAGVGPDAVRPVCPYGRGRGRRGDVGPTWTEPPADAAVGSHPWPGRELVTGPSFLTAQGAGQPTPWPRAPASVMAGHHMVLRPRKPSRGCFLGSPVAVVHDPLDEVHDLRHVLADPGQGVGREDLRRQRCPVPLRPAQAPGPAPAAGSPATLTFRACMSLWNSASQNSGSSEKTELPVTSLPSAESSHSESTSLASSSSACGGGGDRPPMSTGVTGSPQGSRPTLVKGARAQP